jgi:hypothetical protein
MFSATYIEVIVGEALTVNVISTTERTSMY